MSRKRSILIVEDELDLADSVGYNLEREGYAFRRASDGETALAEVRRQQPDLIILDRMLPGRSGDEVATELKRDTRTSGIPIIMLTAKAEESDELVGFALGADDYVAKPFSMKLLLARVAAILRRSDAASVDADVISIGPVTVDQGRHQVTVQGDIVSLTTTEFRVLRTLMAASGRVLDREQLINTVLGPTVAVTDRTIDVHIAAVRKKLGSAAEWIQTVRGVGYTFRAPK
ncbi:MAG: response regulator transcription factor [Phycisphaerae bacterium]|nr:response regulator transcription factor [Phycisphaerae bacterium]